MWCALALVDVKNAFNTASWTIILERVRKRKVDKHIQKIVASYLQSRMISIGKNSIKISRGVPQGFILGPTLWNLYNEVFSIAIPTQTTLIAYADDLAAVVTGTTKKDLVKNMNTTLEKIDEWLISNKLEMAPEKNELFLRA